MPNFQILKLHQEFITPKKHIEKKISRMNKSLKITLGMIFDKCVMSTTFTKIYQTINQVTCGTRGLEFKETNYSHS